MNSSEAFHLRLSIAARTTRPEGSVFEHSTAYRLTCMALLVWWIAFLYPLMPMHDIEEGNAATATAQGSLTNQLLGFSFAALGALYLPRALRAVTTRQETRWMFYLLGAYLLWSAATVVWSDDITLSIRRFGQLILILVGAFGLGAGFYTRTREGTLTLGRHVFYASWIAIAMLIISRLPSGGLSELTNPEWTLKENTAWQFYVFPVAYGLIAALVIFHRSAKVKIALSVSLLSLALILLKGRTMIAGTLAAALIVVSALAKRRFARTIALSIGVLLSLGQLDLATGGWMFLSFANFIIEKIPTALPFITLGNGVNDLLTLDGRIPLWQALWPYFEEGPIIGHGFGAFWNPSRFDTIYYDAGWTAVVAHNGFFEELLGTGIIGLLLFLVFWFRVLRFTAHLPSPDRRAGYLVLGWGLLFLFVNSTGSILQFYFQAPTLFSFAALFALLGRPLMTLEGTE